MIDRTDLERITSKPDQAYGVMAFPEGDAWLAGMRSSAGGEYVVRR
jgi:hypothetical protein